MNDRLRAGFREHGFSLIELMVVVAVVGILSAIAFPAYREYVAKSRRADAQAALVGWAGAMERYFVQSNSYDGAADADGVPTMYPSQVPLEGGTASYWLRITSLTDTDFTLAAQPTGSQAADKCGTLTLDAAGRQGVTGASVAATECWKN